MDNSSDSYSLNHENGLPIVSFYGDKTDKELYRLNFILENLSEVNDVKKYIKHIVKNNSISYDKALDLFLIDKLHLNDKKKTKSISSNITGDNRNIENDYFI